MLRWVFTGMLFIGLMGLPVPPGWAQNQPPPSVSSQEAEAALLERVGVDSSRPRPMSLHDVILMALRNNRDIEIERINGQLAEHQLTASRGAYDPILTSTLSFESATLPVASVLSGGPNGRLATDTYVYNFSMEQRLPTGASYRLSLDNDRLTSSNVFISLNPQYSNTLNFAIRQPLLRNWGWDANRRAIRISQKRLDLSDAEFRGRVIEIINQVQKAYWDLVFTRRNLEVQQDAVDWAQRQLNMNRRMVEAGTLARVEIIAAEAEVKRREETLLMAVQSVTLAENVLKGLVLENRTDPVWGEVIIPTESVEIQTVPLDLSDAVRLAFGSRPEIKQLDLQNEINDVDVRYYRNQTRPQVDVVGTYAISGLAGNPRSQDNPFSSANTILQNRVNLLSELAGLPPLNLPQTGGLPSFLIGGQGKVFSNLFSNDFRTVQVGISISLPLRNRTAEGQLGGALAERRLLTAQRAKLEQAIEVEVRNALQAVETARKRVEAARAAREAAQANLDSEQRRYEAGETTNFFVLTRQNELSAAQSQEVRALMDYNKAIAELQRTTGTTLSTYNVNIQPSQTNP